ncbi:hypothetical protein ACG873_30450 [Mesorhizobium sp. AaZ16]|uniref:hypothetical protein n=1 Tax=Mesorhizobium sp. AaZ16 TaxID=3402289 RepID=UPI00374E549F
MPCVGMRDRLGKDPDAEREGLHADHDHRRKDQQGAHEQDYGDERTPEYGRVADARRPAWPVPDHPQLLAV